MRISLGQMSTLIVGQARVVKTAAVKRGIVVVYSKEGIRAYWNECQHLPAPLDGDGGELITADAIVCRAHGARYTLEDGLCFSGPCRGAFLEPVRLAIEGDELFADL